MMFNKVIWKALWKNEGFQNEVEKVWTHADSIKDLRTDKFVSNEYLEHLIKVSTQPKQIKSIFVYLKNPDKVDNLTGGQLLNLMKLATNRIRKLEESEIMKHIIDEVRKNGMIHFIDWFM